MESNVMTKMPKILLVSAVLLMLVVCIAPASAEIFSDYHHINIGVANDAGARFDIFNDHSYYFNFSKASGGLKAIHITNNTNDLDGEVYTSQGTSGTFYITDTSTDTQYHDDAILMFAIPYDAYDPDDENFSLQITTSGYQWIPTGDGSKPTNPTYNSSGLSETFDMSDFLGDADNTTARRPAGINNYPIYYDQSSGEEFNVMFIDLNLGTLNDTSLINKGAVQVVYTLSNYDGGAAFDVYAYNNQSAQAQGVSWTNRGIDGDTACSGWEINL